MPRMYLADAYLLDALDGVLPDPESPEYEKTSLREMQGEMMPEILMHGDVLKLLGSAADKFSRKAVSLFLSAAHQRKREGRAAPSFEEAQSFFEADHSMLQQDGSAESLGAGYSGGQGHGPPPGYSRRKAYGPEL